MEINNPDATFELPLKKNSEGYYIVIPKKKGYSAIDIMHKAKVNKGFVYFVRAKDTDYYKIGVSTDPYKRIQAIDSNCPFELCILSLHELLNPYQIEEQLKDKYKMYNVKKEWFTFNTELAKEIMIYLHNINVIQYDTPDKDI